MAKDKLSANPTQVQRKKEKEKALKKAKLEKSTRRTEKLARRNPDRLQRQIDDLKALAEQAPLNARDKKALDELERDLSAVKKARETLGEAAPKFESRAPRGDQEDGPRGGGRGGRARGGGGQGLRRRREDDSDETDEEVRRIPMPRDTPPPIPPEYLFNQRGGNANANMTPLGAPRMETGPHPLPVKPDVPAVEQTKANVQVVYESAPQIRDLRKEATKFMPVAVQRKIAAVKSGGRLLEEEEAESLEKEGYMAIGVDAESGNAAPAAGADSSSISTTTPFSTAPNRRAKVEDANEDGDMDMDMKELEEEEKRFRREVDMRASDGKAENEDMGLKKMEDSSDVGMGMMEASLDEKERQRVEVVNLSGEIVWNMEVE